MVAKKKAAKKKVAKRAAKKAIKKVAKKSVKKVAKKAAKKPAKKSAKRLSGLTRLEQQLYQRMVELDILATDAGLAGAAGGAPTKKSRKKNR